MANTVSRYLQGLTVNSQYLGITVWMVYCPLLCIVIKYKFLTLPLHMHTCTYMQMSTVERCCPEHGFSLPPSFSPSLLPLHYNATLPCAMNQTSTVSASRPVVVLMKCATDHFLSRPITPLFQEHFSVTFLQGIQRSVVTLFCVKSVVLCRRSASVAVSRIYVIP